MSQEDSENTVTLQVVSGVCVWVWVCTVQVCVCACAVCACMRMCTYVRW